MKTYGLLETHEVISIVTNDSGEPNIENLRPRGQYALYDKSAPWNQPDPIKPDDHPEDAPWNPDPVSHDPADYPGLLWTPPAMAELVKLPRPYTSAGKTADPVLIWTEANVTREWVIRDMTPVELADSLRKTWPTTKEFLAELTMVEMGGIGLSQDPTIAALRMILATWVGPIYSDDARVVMGLDAIRAAGIITTERQAKIIALPVPAPEPIAQAAPVADTATPTAEATLEPVLEPATPGTVSF